MGDLGELSKDILEEWAVWRLVLAKVATLEEIDNHWSWGDVRKANALLQWKDDYAEAYRIHLEKPRK